MMYFHAVNGEELSEDYVGVDLNGYEQTIREEDYAAFGFEEAVWGEMNEMTVSCEYSLAADYELELPDGTSYKNTAIFEQCTLSIAFENGSTMEGFTETYYVKDLGNGPVEARLYINDVPYFETSYQIVQASLLEEPVFSDLDATDDNYIAIDYLYEKGVLGG